MLLQAQTITKKSKVDKPAPQRALPRAILLDRLFSGPLRKSKPVITAPAAGRRGGSGAPAAAAAVGWMKGVGYPLGFYSV